MLTTLGKSGIKKNAYFKENENYIKRHTYNPLDNKNILKARHGTNIIFNITVVTMNISMRGDEC